MNITGSEALIKTLINEKVNVIFGYPGGTIMPVYDALFDYKEKVKHILSRHEQGAIHAAQGYARSTGKTGIVFVTSGPGATNIVTGLADAMADSTPLVCISGQVDSKIIGTDAFQEADIIGITLPITKWNYRLTNADDIPDIISKAMFIASTGRPGPVLIDITKDAQFKRMLYYYKKCQSVKAYEPIKYPVFTDIEYAAGLIKQAKKPLIIFGQGVKISNAKTELKNFIEKTGIPAVWTILGLDCLPTNHPLNLGMLGMHGNYVANSITQDSDLIIAIGMRFDDRVTGDTTKFATKASIIHIDIDVSEINKVIKSYHAVNGDAKFVLSELGKLVPKKNLSDWIIECKKDLEKEYELVVRKEMDLNKDEINMAMVVYEINEILKGDAIVTTDVGQHQMVVSRYININDGQLITSGGLGTMGFGLPAAIGAKIGNPDKTVVAIVGDGGVQMTVQELGTIMQERLNVKIIILNNGFLGMVRQWQELFFNRRYSYTEMKNPDFQKLSDAYNIKSVCVENLNDLRNAIITMFKHDGPYVLEVKVEKESNVFPMIPSGKSVTETKFYK